MTNASRPLQQHPSLAVAAQDWITNEILAGRILPGQKLAEERLAEQMGISRSPVREALRSLAGHGLIVVEPRRGAFVAEIDARQAADLYACRLLIEPECVREAAGALTEDVMRDLADAFARMQQAVSAGESDVYVTSLEAYNRDLLEACPNRLLFGFAESTWRQSLRYWGLLARHRSTYLNDSLDRNTAINDAVMRRDGDAAGAALTALLEWSRDELAGIIAALQSNDVLEGN